VFGATFTGHPWTEEVGVTVEEPDHPLVAAFGGKDFRIFDEIYQYGVTTCELDDRDPERLVHGWLALQVHVGLPMCVQFKDIYLRRL